MKNTCSVLVVIVLLFVLIVTGYFGYKQTEGMKTCNNRYKHAKKKYKKKSIDMNDYILKTQIVPPVCPVCPTYQLREREKPCPECPPCGRCPESNFECKKVEIESGNQPVSVPIITDVNAY